MNRKKKGILTTFIASAAIVGTSDAATINPSFNVDPASTTINTTGANVVDWGYFLPDADFLDGTQPANTNFDNLTAGGGSIDPATNSKASPTIGAVTITERGDAQYSNASTSLWEFTVNDGINPVGGTYTPLGAVNGIAGNEDIFNITFNDLGAGPKLVTLFMAHSNIGRKFDATIDSTATDYLGTTVSLTSDAIGGTGGTTYFTFATEIDTTDALADLSISIDSNSGGSGQFAFAGYTVVAIPEPSVALLSGLGMLALLRRRRA